MKCVGIVAEYNPFHNGHAWHIAQAKEKAGADFACIVMSGNYAQRAEPAIYDKWTRTRMALAGGADLVIELPTLYSTASSEIFAEAGVRLLTHTHAVDDISFGAEHADASMLQELAAILAQEPAAYQDQLKQYLDEGTGFASARASALSEVSGISSDMINQPNMILAMDYCKAIQKTGSPLQVLPVGRSSDYHASSEKEAPSASVLRDMLRGGQDIQEYMPAEVYRVMKPQSPAQPLDNWSLLLYDRLLHHTAQSLQDIRDVSEGLENRILQVINHPMPISEAVDFISTKRYPKSRIRRILLSILLDIHKDFPRDPAYIRILGFRKEAEALLSRIVTNSDIPVITNPARQVPSLSKEAQTLFRREIYYTDVCLAYYTNMSKNRGAELTEPIVLY